jgi:hypothetical protein
VVQDRTRAIVEAHVDDDFEWGPAQDAPPTRDDVTTVEAALGCQLPAEYLAHLLGELGGLHVEAREETWPRPLGGRAWMFHHGLYVYGLGAGIPAHMHLEHAAHDFASGLLRAPCLKVIGDADVYGFDGNGAIGRFDHETAQIEPFQGSFFALLDHELSELRARKERMLARRRG